LKYGIISTSEINHGGGRGAPGTAFWLNQGQALRIVTLSETEKADDASKQIIDVFIAYRKGLIPAPVEEDRTHFLARALIEACKEIEENRKTPTLFVVLPKAQAAKT
jgi:hypothetical protein